MPDFKFLFLADEGRLTRKPFWIGTIVLSIVEVIVDLFVGRPESPVSVGISVIVGIALLYPSICLGIKRFHDRDKSGWWFLIILVPVIGTIWFFVETGFLRGTVGPNRFGPDPLAPQAGLVQA